MYNYNKPPYKTALKQSHYRLTLGQFSWILQGINTAVLQQCTRVVFDISSSYQKQPDFFLLGTTNKRFFELDQPPCTIELAGSTDVAATRLGVLKEKIPTFDGGDAIDEMHISVQLQMNSSH